MAFEQRDNSGALFKNDNRTSENHPHMKGKCMIGGVEYWISAWTKEGAKGRFQSLSFTPVQQKDQAVQQAMGVPKSHQVQQQRQGSAPPSFSDMDDDIPFLFNLNTVCDMMPTSKQLMRAKHGKGMHLLQNNKANF